MSIGIDFPILAENLLADGKFSEALELCREGVDQYPDYSLGKVMLAKALSLSGNETEAEKVAGETAQAMGYAKAAKKIAEGDKIEAIYFDLTEPADSQIPPINEDIASQPDDITESLIEQQDKDQVDQNTEDLWDDQTQVDIPEEGHTVSESKDDENEIAELEPSIDIPADSEMLSDITDDHLETEYQDDSIDLITDETGEDPDKLLPDNDSDATIEAGDQKEYDISKIDQEIYQEENSDHDFDSEQPVPDISNESNDISDDLPSDTIKVYNEYHYSQTDLIPGLAPYSDLERAAHTVEFSADIEQSVFAIDPATIEELSPEDNSEFSEDDRPDDTHSLSPNWQELEDQIESAIATPQADMINDEPQSDPSPWDDLYHEISQAVSSDSEPIEQSEISSQATDEISNVYENVINVDTELSETKSEKEVDISSDESNNIGSVQQQIGDELVPSSEAEQDTDVSSLITKELVEAIKDADYSVESVRDMMDEISSSSEVPLDSDPGPALEMTETIAQIFWDQEAYSDAISSFQTLIQMYPDLRDKYEKMIETIKNEADEKGASY